MADNMSPEPGDNASAVGTGEVQQETADQAGQTADVREADQGSGDALAKAEAEVAALRAELSELKDQYLRKQADHDNFRKRMIRDKEEGITYANRKLLEDLLPILDDLERAINSSEDSRDYQVLHDGIQLIEKEFISMLEKKWGLVRFESIGKEFDPIHHEAVLAEPVDGSGNQSVLEEFQRGYILNDKVIRTAKVKVSVPSKEGE